MCIIWNIKKVFLSEIFLILGRFERDMTKMSIDLQVKYPLFWSDLNQTRIFWTDFQKKSSNIIKILAVGTELLRVDGQTDRLTNA